MRLLGNLENPTPIRLGIRAALHNVLRILGRLVALLFGEIPGRQVAPILGKHSIFLIEGMQHKDLEKSRDYFASLEGMFTGRSGWVIGNGPSLRMADLELLKGKISIASNKIYLAYEETTWRPQFYTVIDEILWPKIASELDRFFETVLISPRLDHSLTRAEHFLLPVQREDLVKLGSQRRFSDSAGDGFFMGRTVTLVNLQLAAFMGLDPIFLLGVDHKYLGEDGRGGRAVHSVKNHFSERYREQGEVVYGANMEAMNQGYQEAAIWAQESGRRILNASRESALEAFPRISFEEAIEIV